MNYATAKEIAAAAIPVIDMAPLHEGRRESAQRVAAELLAAAQAVGFFYVRNHGVSLGLITLLATITTIQRIVATLRQAAASEG